MSGFRDGLASGFRAHITGFKAPRLKGTVHVVQVLSAKSITEEGHAV